MDRPVDTRDIPIEVGDFVSAESETGRIVEGSVFAVLPFHTVINPDWGSWTIVIRDEGTRELSPWRAEDVTVVQKKGAG